MFAQIFQTMKHTHSDEKIFKVCQVILNLWPVVQWVASCHQVRHSSDQILFNPLCISFCFLTITQPPFSSALIAFTPFFIILSIRPLNQPPQHMQFCSVCMWKLLSSWACLRMPTELGVPVSGSMSLIAACLSKVERRLRTAPPPDLPLFFSFFFLPRHGEVFLLKIKKNVKTCSKCHSFSHYVSLTLKYHLSFL